MQLCFAAANGDLPRVKAIVDELSADVVTMSDYDGRTPLHLACSESNKDIVRILPSSHFQLCLDFVRLNCQ